MLECGMSVAPCEDTAGEESVTMRNVTRGLLCAISALALWPDFSAAAELPDNAAGSAIRRFAAAGVLWVWPAGSVIQGCFTNGTPEERALVVEGGQTWSSVANIRFDFGAAPGLRDCPVAAPFPPLRVAFGSGNLSHARLGTLALDRPNEKPTMFITTSTPSKRPIQVESTRATILHELGHVLGLKHEHQHPESACFHMVSWANLCAKRETERRLPSFIVTNWLPMIGEVNADYLAGWPYDPLSIMHYKYPSNTFTGPATTCAGARNYVLSEGDKAKIAKLYPKSLREQEDMIASQAPFVARAILSARELDQAGAERVAREAERIVRLGHPSLVGFRIDLGPGLANMKPSRGDKGSGALTSFATGAVEAAASACAKAEAPLQAGAAMQILRQGDH